MPYNINMNVMRRRGSIFILVLIIIATIALLGYFGISVQRDIVGNPTVQSNFGYVTGEVKYIWVTYLKETTLKIWSWAVNNVLNLPVGTGNNGINVPQIDTQSISIPSDVPVN